MGCFLEDNWRTQRQGRRMDFDPTIAGEYQEVWFDKNLLDVSEGN